MLTGHRMSGRSRRLAALALACLVFAAAGSPRPAHADPDDLQKRIMVETLLAQQITKGKGVTVAVLSTGVDPQARPRSGTLRPGKDFTGLPHPKRLEGTLIASVLGGARPLPGLVPAADILPVRVVPDNADHGAKDWWDSTDVCDVLARGIRYAVDHGAGVVLVVATCWGTDAQRTELGTALDHARSRNAVVVAPNEAVGSDGLSPLPTALPGVIGVGTLAKDGTRWSKFSLKNSVTLVSAPGGHTPSVGPGGRSGWEFWGPPAAEVWVAATAALIRAEFPRLSPTQVAQAIASSAHHPKGGYNTDLGFGVVDPVQALGAAKEISGRPVQPTGSGVADDAHFGRAGTIDAVRHNSALLGGLAGLILASVGALVAAAIRLRPGRRTKTETPYPWTSTT